MDSRNLPVFTLTLSLESFAINTCHSFTDPCPIFINPSPPPFHFRSPLFQKRLSLHLQNIKFTKMDSGNSRRTCFVVEDDGLASLADVEAGFSGNHHRHNQQHNNYAFFSRPLPYASSSMRNLSSSSSSSVCTSPRSGPRFYYDARYEEPKSSFLDSCALCKKPLGNRDIYMYSDCAFCSEECRQERIDVDYAKEKKRSLSSSMKALRKKEQQRKSTSPNKNQNYSYHTSPVAAA